MAETVSKASTVTHTTHNGHTTVTVLEQTTVWSISGRIDVSILDNLVVALAEAGAPKNALVASSNTGEGHLCQLRVQWETERRITPEAGDE